MKFFWISMIFCSLFTSPLMVQAAENVQSGTVNYDIDLKVKKGAKNAKVFLPYPMSDKYQDISNVKIAGNYDDQGIYHDPKTGSTYLKATWNNIKEKPQLSMSFHIDSHYNKGTALKESTEKLPVEVLPYLLGNDFLPVEHKMVKELVKEATAGKTSYLDRARAIYDWTIANTHRDPDVKGCGLGSAIATLTEANGGGKCADISAVFITIARAAGIPTREVFGLRSAAKDGAITGDFHCWAEFYLPETGWVMVDPADVRKAMLIEKLELNDAATKKHAEFFWNGDNLFRIAVSRSEHGVLLPEMQGAPITYFMYPYAEIDGEPVDYFAPNDFSFKVSLKRD